MSENFAVIGGAGFIGSHFAAELLKQGNSVLVYDNFCSGTHEHIFALRNNSHFQLVQADAEDTDRLAYVLRGIDTVIHLASNPDIAKAAIEPRIDFTQGTVLTESVMEASRRAKVSSVLYASGSGVYGDAGRKILREESQLNPISTYGASKLAGEAMLSAYSFMFEIKSISFRFANVVGDMQTHGVGYDFLRKLRKNPRELEILGNGRQSKSYIHVTDVISGVLTAHSKTKLFNDVFNISTDDYLDVLEIAELSVEILGLDSNSVEFKYLGGERGWKADVPIVRLDSSKLKNLGWKSRYTSRQAVKKSLTDMLQKLED